jgi:hypothetical protein
MSFIKNLVKRLSHTDEEAVVSVSFQLVALAILCGWVIFFWYSGSFFTCFDKPPTVHVLTPSYIKKFGGTPSDVTVGLYINNFTKFDIDHNEFVFNGVLWFIFDQSNVASKVLGLTHFERGEILERSAPLTRIVGSQVFVQYNVRVKFTTSLSYSFFPLDDHTLYLVMGNKYFTPGEVSFKSSNRDFVIAENVDYLGWKKYLTNVYSGYCINTLDRLDVTKNIEYPVVVFKISYIHSGVQQGLIIFLPLFILFLLGIFSFSLDPLKNYTMILSISLASISGLLGFRFVVQSLSPNVGYFMVSDYFFFMFLMLSAIILLINFFVVQMPRHYKKLIIISLYGFIMAILWYLLTILGV